MHIGHAVKLAECDFLHAGKRRVANRVAKGDHDVPSEKIGSRYCSSLKVLETLIPYTYRCYLFDNSEDGIKDTINLIAEIENSQKLIVHSESVPVWVQENIIDRLF